MSREKDEFYRYRNGYLKFKSALCDRNTGLLSYTLLLDEIRRLFEIREQVAVLAVQVKDLERMESIYGWQACDRLLEKISSSVRATVGEQFGEAALVTQDGVHQGRFVLFLPELVTGEPATALAAAKAASHMQDCLDEVFSGAEFAGMTPAVRFSCGSRLLTENPFFRFERLVRAAVDGAMESLQASDNVQSQLESEIRAIIRNGRLEVLYQPVLALEGRRIIGYEAFVRGPAETILESPAMLFSYGDQFGLAGELDGACRRRALEAAVALDPGRLLFVNSLLSFLDGEAAEDGALSGLLRGTGRTPESVVLEVPERCFQALGPAQQRTLHELRALGIQFAIDHAGSGYSTLKLIQDLRPDFVKIDSTLVRGLNENLLQQEVARSVVAVAKRVGSKVVAPGVETEEEAVAARRCGVSLGQGFHLARPQMAVSTQAPWEERSQGAPSL